MIRRIGLALVLMTMAGVASAHDRHDDCEHHLRSDSCGPSDKPKTAVAAPEIDPASAMAGFTLLAGGLAVLCGRRKPPYAPGSLSG